MRQVEEEKRTEGGKDNELKSKKQRSKMDRRGD